MSSKFGPAQRLGVDIGRVVIAPSTDDREDTSFFGGSLANALATPPNVGVFEHLPIIVERFDGAVWLVSKAGARIEERTRSWLAHHRFHERTGIPADNIRFCRERHQKADHCAELGLSHFIDDRQDVLQHMEGLVPNRFLFGPQREPVADKGLTKLATWAEANLKVLPQVSRRAARLRVL